MQDKKLQDESIRIKANLLENGLYVTGIGVGSVLVSKGIKKAINKNSRLVDKILGILEAATGVTVSAISGHNLIIQKPLTAAVGGDDLLDGLFIGSLLIT